MMNEKGKSSLVEEIRRQISTGKSIYDLALRVTYYARVSSDSEEQATSVVNQVDYFCHLIQANSNWTFIGGYIDEGISGKSVNKREAFLKMIDDAQKDQFDLILTKSVPRFARNTLDSIRYTEELLKYGVGVYFLNDNINTFLPDSEFRLTLMASIAQDDLRKLSENVKFGLRQSIKRGVVLGSNNIYGYIKDKGSLKIIEKEATIVKKMFILYDSYSSLKKTSLLLEKLGYFNRKGKPFDTTTIRRILMNPKYKGYYCGNKTTVLDYKSGITKQLTKDKWVVYKDNKKIPPIVSEELWDRVNHELAKKQNNYHSKKRINTAGNYAYSGKLICKEHKIAYTRSGRKKNRQNDYRYWSCRLYKRGVKYCSSPLLKESNLDIWFQYIISKFFPDKEMVKERLINRIKKFNTDEEFTQKQASIAKKQLNLETQKEKLFELVSNNYITNEEFRQKNEILNQKLYNLKTEQQTLEAKAPVEGKNKQLILQLDRELDIKYHLADYIDLLVDCIYVSKVDNNRHLVRLEIVLKTGLNILIDYDQFAMKYKENWQLNSDENFVRFFYYKS